MHETTNKQQLFSIMEKKLSGSKFQSPDSLDNIINAYV